jgi:hypothetical protein
MSLREWWEARQQRKHEEQNAKLLDLAEHPQGSPDAGGTDIDELRTEQGNSRLGHGGEMRSQDVERIE